MIEGAWDALLVERFVQCFVELTEQRYDAATVAVELRGV